MIVTKLDEVNEKDRVQVLQYIEHKMEKLQLNIPIYVPYTVEMPDDSFDAIMGMDKVQCQIESWMADSRRRKLTEDWILARTLSVLDVSERMILDKQIMAQESNEELKRKLILEKKNTLSSARIKWEDLRLKFMEKSNCCHQLLYNKAGEYKESVTERLQYELMHAQSPQKWWEEDFPYCLKLEISQMAAEVNNVIIRQIHEDISWFDRKLAEDFQSNAAYTGKTAIDSGQFENFNPIEKLEFEDMNQKRNLTRIGTSVVTLAGALLMSSMGMMPIIATIGIGTAASILTDQTFRKKMDEQKEDVKGAIARAVPQAIEYSLDDSNRRLSKIYEDVLEESEKSEKVWLETQNQMFVEAVAGLEQTAEKYKPLLEKIAYQKEAIYQLGGNI